MQVEYIEVGCAATETNSQYETAGTKAGTFDKYRTKNQLSRRASRFIRRRVITLA